MKLKHPLLWILTSFIAFSLNAQTTSNIQQPLSINNDGAAPDASAILDIQSTAHGVLVPRVTSAQRTDIAAPANGLLVFDTDTGGFWFYQGGWQSLSNTDNLGNHEATQDLNLNSNSIINLTDPANGQDAATKAYVDANDDVADADADPMNELQTLGSVLSEGNDAGGAAVTNLLDPVNGQDAATKAYVDSSDDVADADADPANELQTLGSVLSEGNDAGGAAVTNLLDPVNGQDAATKAYVDSNDDVADADADPANELQTLGSVLSEGNDAGGAAVTNLLDPVNAQDAATKAYVDSNDDVADADADPANELQTLGSVLSEGNDAGGAAVTNLLDPVNGQDAATKAYVDSNDDVADADADPANELQTLGSVLSEGNDAGGAAVTNLLDPVNGQDAATKAYVDSSDDVADADADPANELQTLGSVLSEGNDAGGAAVTNLLDPVNAQDAATKAYVDGKLPTNNIQDADGDTKVQVEESSDEDIIRFDIAGTEKMVLKKNANSITRLEILDLNKNTIIGQEAGQNHSGSKGTFIGYRAGKTNSSGFANTFVGAEAGEKNTTGDSNTAFGAAALFSNTDGFFNTATGVGALEANTQGDVNTAIGYYALGSNTTGDFNTAIGEETLTNNETGNYNTAVGSEAMMRNETGEENTAIGRNALRFNFTGSYNTAVGFHTIFTTTHSSRNTAIGYEALYQMEDSSNVALGYRAGYLPYAGTHCTYIGYQTDMDDPDSIYHNSTAIGNETHLTASNQVRLGNTLVNSIGGYADWTNVSDGRFKRDVRENVPGLDFVMKLRPVTYHLNVNGLAKRLNEDWAGTESLPGSEKAGNLSTGFIAQEVEAAAKAIGYEFSGVDGPQNGSNLYGLRYAQFSAPLVKAVQEQQAIIEKQQEEIKTQNSRIAQLENLRAELEEMKALLLGSGLYLEGKKGH